MIKNFYLIFVHEKNSRVILKPMRIENRGDEKWEKFYDDQSKLSFTEFVYFFFTRNKELYVEWGYLREKLAKKHLNKAKNFSHQPFSYAKMYLTWERNIRYANLWLYQSSFLCWNINHLNGSEQSLQYSLCQLLVNELLRGEEESVQISACSITSSIIFFLISLSLPIKTTL